MLGIIENAGFKVEIIEPKSFAVSNNPTLSLEIILKPGPKGIKALNTGFLLDTGSVFCDLMKAKLRTTSKDNVRSPYPSPVFFLITLPDKRLTIYGFIIDEMRYDYTGRIDDENRIEKATLALTKVTDLFVRIRKEGILKRYSIKSCLVMFEPKLNASRVWLDKKDITKPHWILKYNHGYKSYKPEDSAKNFKKIAAEIKALPYSTSRNQLAKDILLETLKLYGKDEPITCEFMARCFIDENNHKRALDWYEKVREEELTMTGLVHKGICKKYLSDLHGAERDLKKAAIKYPQEWLPYYNLACILSLQGKIKPALVNLEKAVDVNYKKVLKNIEFDPDLESLLSHPNFIALINRIRNQ